VVIVSPVYKNIFSIFINASISRFYKHKKIAFSRKFTLKTQDFCDIIDFIISCYDKLGVQRVKKIKRSADIWAAIENHANRQDAWTVLKTVAVVSGLAGCGKTTQMLDYFKGKKHFYFSFAGLEEGVAERLFTEKVAALTGNIITNWEEALIAVSKAYRFIILDDLSPLASYKRFKSPFYENMCQDFRSRPLVFLIAQPTDDLRGLADNFDRIEASYFSIPEVMKLFPKLSKFYALGLSAVSGGIPKILLEYNEQMSFEDNLRYMLRPASNYCGSMPYLMDKYFRKPEIYNSILYAIACGNRRISEIGKFTGFAYNKCDNYVSALVSVGFVAAEKEKAKGGAEKTVYTLTNAYFRLWYRYVYQNRTGLAVSNEGLAERFVKSVIKEDIHAFHLEKAFAYVNHRLGTDLWASFRISEKVVYLPITVKKGSFCYTFDAIYRNGEKVVFVKVFADPLENCKKGELDRIRKVVMLVNKYYNSHIFLFAKRRFSDYAAQQAPLDEAVSVIEVERLRF
jgi:AAA+ ATPase superfamily predicted ATPase